jgi:hypothetical protein
VQCSGVLSPGHLAELVEGLPLVVPQEGVVLALGGARRLAALQLLDEA